VNAEEHESERPGLDPAEHAEDQHRAGHE
jgi:hypothetical protein